MYKEFRVLAQTLNNLNEYLISFPVTFYTRNLLASAELNM